MSHRVEIVSNIQPKKIGLNVRRDGPQPSLSVRSFSPITTSNLSREARRNDCSTLRASHGSRSSKSRIGPTFLTRNTVFLSRIPGSKKSPSQTLDSCRFLCYTTSTESKWCGRPVGD